MEIKSVFSNREQIPKLYTCDGSDINPPLIFLNVPKEAKSLVLIMDDPDSPTGLWVHWILFNIPPFTSEIKKNFIPNNALQGKNSWGANSYGGPCPSKGTHRYFFKLYALNTELKLNEGATKEQIEKAMEGHIIEKAELVGLYNRERK